MKSFVLGFMVMAFALLGVHAQGGEYVAQIDSVSPAQYSGDCPTNLRVIGRIAIPLGRTDRVQIVIDQTFPPGTAQSSLPLSGLNMSMVTGTGSPMPIDQTVSVYMAKAVWIEIRGPQTGSWGGVQDVLKCKSNVVPLSFTCAGVYSAKIDKKIDPQTLQQPPSRPENLSAVQDRKIGLDHATSVKLTWQAPAPLVPVAGYTIERKVQGQSGGFLLIAQLAKPQNGPLPLSYDDTGLDYNKTYIYRMKARNQYGESPYSSQATIHTQAGDVVGFMAGQKPAQPTGLRAQVMGPAKVDLYWLVPANTLGANLIKGFVVFRRTPGDVWLPAGTMPVTPNQTTGAFTFHYQNSSLKAGQQYFFRVCSYRDEAQQQISDFSNEAKVTMPKEPVRLAK